MNNLLLPLSQRSLDPLLKTKNGYIIEKDKKNANTFCTKSNARKDELPSIRDKEKIQINWHSLVEATTNCGEKALLIDEFDKEVAQKRKPMRNVTNCTLQQQQMQKRPKAKAN